MGTIKDITERYLAILEADYLIDKIAEVSLELLRLKDRQAEIEGYLKEKPFK